MHLNYTTVGSNDLPRAVAFYEALLGEAGWKVMMKHDNGGRIWKLGSCLFGVMAPRDGNPATVGNGTMIGFALDSVQAVADFHAKALALGGTDEGAPGHRPDDSSPAYFCYFRDLDGNKLCGYNIGGPAA